MTQQMVTGAATADGRPIYMKRDHTWTDRLADGHVTLDQDELARMLQSARGDEFVVCDPYVIEVLVDHARPQPASLREKIRASGGPTIAIAS